MQAGSGARSHYQLLGLPNERRCRLPGLWEAPESDAATPRLTRPAGAAAHTQHVDMSQGFLGCPGTGLWGLPRGRLGAHWDLEGPPPTATALPPSLPWGGKGQARVPGKNLPPWASARNIITPAAGLLLPSAYVLPRDPAARSSHHLPEHSLSCLPPRTHHRAALSRAAPGLPGFGPELAPGSSGRNTARTCSAGRGDCGGSRGSGPQPWPD